MALAGARRGAFVWRRLRFDELERTTSGALAASDRPLQALGHLALWANLGAGLYLLIVGAWLTPALSIPQAVAATIIGAAMGAAIVAGAAHLGATENRPAIVLHRGALGESGANLYGVLACLRHLVFGALLLGVVADVAGSVMSRYGVEGGRPLWAVLLGLLVLLMVLAGPATTARRWLVPSAALTLVIAIVFTYSAWSGFGVPAMLTREPAGGWPSMTGAVDIVAAVALVALPAATDVGRLGSARRAGVATFAGLAGMTAWFVLLGAIFVPAVDGRDLAGFLLATPVSALALLLLAVLELDAAFVSLYSLASTVRGWAPKSNAALPAVLGGACVFVLGAALLDPFAYGDTLLLLGAAFAPLFGVLLGARAARRWVGYGPPPRLGGVLAWGAGFLLYNWASPLTVPAWTPAMSALFHDLLRLPFPAGVLGLSATALAFAAAFALSAASTAVRARRAAHTQADLPQPAGRP
jgi:NCS1 family nucleobase:cation symporter-1